MKKSEPSFLYPTVVIAFFLAELSFFVCRTYGLTPRLLTVTLIGLIAGLLVGMLLDWLCERHPGGPLHELRAFLLKRSV
jgi:hypothetical protein